MTTTTGFDKTLFLIRGLPGSGKDTIGRQLGCVFSADQYFETLVDGKTVYNFDPTKLGEAHKACKEGVVKCLIEGLGPIAVCNTFTQLWELAPYIGLARHYDYRLVILTVESGLTDEELAKRNLHSCPVEAIRKMRARWQTFGL